MRKKLVLVISLLLLFMVNGIILGAETTTVRVRGVSSANKYKTQAREKAVSDGLSKAVEKAVGVIITSRTEIENKKVVLDKLSKKTQGYVSNYKVINQNNSDNQYQVTMQVTVKKGELVNKIDDMEFNIKNRTSNPRVMVIIHQDNPYPVDIPKNLAQNELINGLIKRGFKVIDKNQINKVLDRDKKKAIALNNNYNLTIKYATKIKADLVLIGKIKLNEVDIEYQDDMLEGLSNYSAHLTTKVVNVSNANIITTQSIEVTSAGGNDDIASQEAIKKATTKANYKLSEKLTNKLVNENKTIVLNVNNLNSNQITNIKEILTKLRPTDKVYFKEYNNGLGIYNLELKSDYRTIHLLSALKESNLNSKIKSINNSKLTLKFNRIE